MFKVLCTEVKKQWGKVIKIVRSVEVVSIMGSMVTLDNKRDLFLGTYRKMVLLLSILLLVVLNRMVWQKGVTALLWK